MHHLTLRLPKALFQRVEAERGCSTRSAYLRSLIGAALPPVVTADTLLAEAVSHGG